MSKGLLKETSEQKGILHGEERTSFKLMFSTCTVHAKIHPVDIIWAIKEPTNKVLHLNLYAFLKIIRLANLRTHFAKIRPQIQTTPVLINAHVHEIL